MPMLQAPLYQWYTLRLALRARGRPRALVLRAALGTFLLGQKTQKYHGTAALVNKPHSHISIFDTLNRAARSPVLFILFLHLRRTSASVLEIL